MKTPSKPLAMLGTAAALLALFAAGGVAGRALALPLSPSLVGLAFVALGLRLAVMLAAVVEPAEEPALAVRGAGPRHPALHGAHG